MHEPLFKLLTLFQITYVAPKVYQRVFLYDDLRRRQPFHKYIKTGDNGKSRFLHEGCTKKRYPLVVYMNIALLLNDSGKGLNVFGEIYSVDNEMLKSLDELLNHPFVFCRRLENIQLKKPVRYKYKREMECWTYFWIEPIKELYQLTMLSEYQSPLATAKRRRRIFNHTQRVYIRKSDRTS